MIPRPVERSIWQSNPPFVQCRRHASGQPAALSSKRLPITTLEAAPSPQEQHPSVGARQAIRQPQGVFTVHPNHARPKLALAPLWRQESLWPDPKQNTRPTRTSSSQVFAMPLATSRERVDGLRPPLPLPRTLCGVGSRARARRRPSAAPLPRAQAVERFGFRRLGW